MIAKAYKRRRDARERMFGFILNLNLVHAYMAAVPPQAGNTVSTTGAVPVNAGNDNVVPVRVTVNENSRDVNSQTTSIVVNPSSGSNNAGSVTTVHSSSNVTSGSTPSSSSYVPSQSITKVNTRVANTIPSHVIPTTAANTEVTISYKAVNRAAAAIEKVVTGINTTPATPSTVVPSNTVNKPSHASIVSESAPNSLQSESSSGNDLFPAVSSEGSQVSEISTLGSYPDNSYSSSNNLRHSAIWLLLWLNLK